MSLYMLYYRKEDGIPFNREKEIALGIGREGQTDGQTKYNRIYLNEAVRLPDSVLPDNVAIGDLFNSEKMRDFYHTYFVGQKHLTGKDIPEINRGRIMKQLVIDIPE